MNRELSTCFADRQMTTMDGVSTTLPPLRGGLIETKRSLFRGFAHCSSVARQRKTEFNEWMFWIVNANTTWRKVIHGRSEIEGIKELDNKRDLRIPKLGAGSSLSSTSRCIANMKTDEARQFLEEQRKCEGGGLIAHIESGLTALAKVRQVGEIEWYSQDVCRLSFFENELSDRCIRTEQRDVGGGYLQHFNVFDRSFVSTEVIHDVLDAKVHRVGFVRVPARVKELLRKTPRWLKSELRIVTGQEIGEETQTRTYQVGTWEASAGEPFVKVSFSHDPALVLGPFVICGWR